MTSHQAGEQAVFVQRIPPAGAKEETATILFISFIILLVALSVIALRTHFLEEVSLQEYQVDLSTDLSAVEQGLYTDLQAVYNEWRDLKILPPPEIRVWADDGWPPFMQDLTAGQRGGHHWQRIEAEPLHYAYWGHSEKNDSSNILWRLDLEDLDSDVKLDKTVFDVWVLRAPAKRQTNAEVRKSLTTSLENDHLIQQGWKQVVAHEQDLNQ